MNARGSTEVIVASIGLSVGVLDQRLFSVIVTMAIVTTLIMPPTLRWALGRLPIKKEEQHRLAREVFEEESFVSKLERILLVVDRSEAGKLASALAGHMGGLRNMPITVRDLAREGERAAAPVAAEPQPATATDDEAAQPAEEIVERVKASAEEGIAKAHEEDETREDAIHVETRLTPGELEKSLATEAEKGHDLLYVGVEPLVGDEGGFQPRIEAMLSAFRRSAAIVSARGSLRRNPDEPLRLLVPVSRDVWSMRAVEFAVMLAKASDAKVTALYVRPEQNPRYSTPAERESPHEAVFEHVREIGQHYEVEVRTILGNGRDREISILSQARRGGYNLIILGVGRRAGVRLSFGTIADTLLETSERSLVFFVTT